MTEIWRNIEDFPNYEVSNFGNVRNIKTGRVLRLLNHNGGYLMAGLRKDGKHKLFLIHRLVANAFIPNPENKRTVNHISGDKTDNCVSNLEWATDSENMKHSYRIGLTNGREKQRVRCVETGQEFESYLKASRYFGCGPGSIWGSIHTGCRCKGYRFELI